MMNYFTVEELSRSETAALHGWDNTPDPVCRARLEELVRELLDPLRGAWDGYCRARNLGTGALHVTSGYRSPRLNRAVGGAPGSAHCLGLAADLVPANRRLKDFRDFCRGWLRDRDFDQMISEREAADGTPRWIHLGLRNAAGLQRRELLVVRAGRCSRADG